MPLTAQAANDGKSACPTRDCEQALPAVCREGSRPGTKARRRAVSSPKALRRRRAADLKLPCRGEASALSVPEPMATAPQRDVNLRMSGEMDHEPTQLTSSGVSRRAVPIGVILLVLPAPTMYYAEIVSLAGGPEGVPARIPVSVPFLRTLLIGVPVLKGLGLTRKELLVIYILVVIGAPLRHHAGIFCLLFRVPNYYDMERAFPEWRARSQTSFQLCARRRHPPPPTVCFRAGRLSGGGNGGSLLHSGGPSCSPSWTRTSHPLQSWPTGRCTVLQVNSGSWDRSGTAPTRWISAFRPIPLAPSTDQCLALAASRQGRTDTIPNRDQADRACM